MVGEAKWHLESNSLPSRDAQRAETNLVHQDPETPQKLSQNCVRVSPEKAQISSGLSAAGAEALGAADLYMA